MKRINFCRSLTLFAIIVCFFITTQAFGNINSIDFKKVRSAPQSKDLIDFLQANLDKYDHWVHEWSYSIKKETVIQNLSGLYEQIDKTTDKNIEEYLLLGDIAHYLYNLESEPYYQKAVDNYTKARQLAPEDYRVYWFLANHYALSNQPVLGISTYKTAFKYMQENQKNAFFWFDYSAACFPAGMRSTTLFALAQSNKLHPSIHIQELITQINTTLKNPKPDTTLEVKDVWSIVGKQENKIIFANRVIGIKLAVDSNWGIQPIGFSNGTSAVTFKPTTIVSKVNNEKIDYSMLVLTKIPQQGQSLQDFLSIFLEKYDHPIPVELTNRYKKCIAYEIKDPQIYKNIGGGHMYMLAIERDEPEYPGMALENVDESLAKKSGLSYYTVKSEYTRLKGKLYYLVLLDSCEYIHDESLAVFKNFLENELLIE